MCVWGGGGVRLCVCVFLNLLSLQKVGTREESGRSVHTNYDKVFSALFVVCFMLIALCAPDPTPPPPPPPTCLPAVQMTEEEHAKRDVRRAQNRGAARRFRQKKKQNETELKKVSCPQVGAGCSSYTHTHHVICMRIIIHTSMHTAYTRARARCFHAVHARTHVRTYVCT